MKRLVLLAALLIVVGYGVFEARRLLEGPVVSIASPKNGTATSSTLIAISGVAENIAYLTVDGKPAYTDLSGRFSVTLSPPSGYTIITVAALDRFGRHAQKQVEITVLNYCPIS